jgi:hypothetical protein
MTEKQEQKQEQELDKILQEQIDNLSLNIQDVQSVNVIVQDVQSVSVIVQDGQCTKKQGVSVQEEQSKQQERGINPMIESELKKTLSGFFNEIDLVFDYVDKSIVQRLYKFLKGLNNSENVRKMVTNTLPILKKYETEISHVVTTRSKIRKNNLEFLNNIVLFDDILDFNVFSSENKNTKQSIIKYLYNIYMSIFILNFGLVSDNKIDEFTQELSSFVSSIQKRIEQEKTDTTDMTDMTDTIDTKNKVNSKRSNPINSLNPRSNQNFGNLSNSLNPINSSNQNFGNLLESLMQNGDIMNLATELSKDIQSENLDPMTLLSSMMSGKPDNKIQKLVENITSKIETKINSGEIDQNVLEQQAQSILSTVQNTGGDFQKMFASQINK